MDKLSHKKIKRKNKKKNKCTFHKFKFKCIQIKNKNLKKSPVIFYELVL